MKILIAGDYSPIRRVELLLNNNDFSAVFGDVKTLINGADFSIVNLESPIADDSDKPIEKRGINIRCGETGVKALKWLGFNCVTLANNHVYDYGKEGIKKTLAVCDEIGINTVGCGMDLSEASRTLITTIKGEKVALINCCEHEFSIATEFSAGANPIDSIAQYHAITQAKTEANYIIVIVHGGHEHYQLPSPRMQKLYRFFVDCGADVVVNHHQHCYSGYEVYHDKPIFYGLGNFCFDSEHDNKCHEKTWNYGYFVVLTLKEGKIEFELLPYEQCKESPKVSLMSSPKELSDFNRKIQILNNDIANKEQLHANFMKWVKKSKNYSFMFPYRTRIMKSLCFRGIVPSFITREKLLFLNSILSCESYNDILRYNLEDDLYNKRK